MSIHNQVVDVSADANYPPNPQVVVPFEPRRITVILEDDLGEGALVSFDGVNDHGGVVAGSANGGLVFGQRNTRVWLKRKAAGAGTINVRVIAEKF